MVDVEKEKIKGEEIHEEIQRIRYDFFLNLAFFVFSMLAINFPHFYIE